MPAFDTKQPGGPPPSARGITYMTDAATETKLAHFEMQAMADGPTGDWRLAMPAAALEIARLIGETSDISPERRHELIQIGAALIKGSTIMGVPDASDAQG